MGSYYCAFVILLSCVLANEPTLVYFEIHHPRGKRVLTVSVHPNPDSLRLQTLPTPIKLDLRAISEAFLNIYGQR